MPLSFFNIFRWNSGSAVNNCVFAWIFFNNLVNFSCFRIPNKEFNSPNLNIFCSENCFLCYWITWNINLAFINKPTVKTIVPLSCWVCWRSCHFSVINYLNFANLGSVVILKNNVPNFNILRRNNQVACYVIKRNIPTCKTIAISCWVYWCSCWISIINNLGFANLCSIVVFENNVPNFNILCGYNQVACYVIKRNVPTCETIARKRCIWRSCKRTKLNLFGF